MAINFPDSPNINDVHTESSLGKSWKWDGTTWLIYSSSTTGIALGDLSVSSQSASGGGALTYNNTNGIFTYTPPALTTTFTGLTDTPSSFTSNKWLKVNSGGTALELVDPPSGSDTNDYLNTASLSGNILTLTRTGSQSLSDVTVDLSALSSVPTTITVADESVDVECFPLFTTAATGNLAPKTGSNIKFNSASGQLEAGSFKKTGGASTEFLKADGSVDSTSYSSLSNIVDNAQGVAVTGKVATTDGIDIDIGGGINAAGTSIDFQNTTISFSGASIGGLQSTINAGVDVHLNKSTAGTNEVLSWNGTDYDWVAQSGGGGGGTTINNNADNRIITGSATAGELNAEASFQCDGNALFLSDNKAIKFGSNLRMQMYTDGSVNYIKSATDGSGAFPIEIHSGSTEAIKIDSSGNTIIGGNLTVNGTQTIINTATLEIEDGDILLNKNQSGSPTLNAGIEIERGDSSNVRIRWNESTDKWDFTNDGTNYKNIDENTTYDLAATASSGNATITLSGSDSTNDVVTLSGGGGTSFQVTGNTIQINSVNTIGALTDVNLGGGSPADDSILQYNSANTEWEVVSGSSVGASVPVGTIVMYNGDTAPSGWALCDGSGGRPDLRDKFVIGSGSSYSRGSTGGYADAIVVNHNHNAGNQSANHTHAPGNSMATNFTGDHYHQQSGSGSGTTGNQSANHYHTIGGNKPDGSPGTWNVTTSGGAHTHQQYRNNYSVNTPYDAHGYGRSSSSTSVAQGVNTGSSEHSHTIDLTGVTTGGIDQNHTHDFNFNISGNTTYSSTGNHAHNINGNTGNESANHNHNINAEGSSGSGRNIPPYYAITFIIKT